ncbi:MAG: putative Zn-dependent peptidase, partial [Myxococcota bacterium]
MRPLLKTLKPLIIGMFALGMGCATGPSIITRPDRPTTPPVVRRAPIQPIGSTTLTNGLRVQHYAGEGRFTAVLRVEAGPSDEPTDLPGLRTMLAKAAVLGTFGDPDRPSSPHRRALLLGGQLDHQIKPGTIAWRIDGPLASASGLLAVLFDVATRPSLRATQVQMMAEIDREALSVTREPTLRRGVAWAAGLAMHLGRPIPERPTEATLTSMHREDLLRLHAHVVRPERGLLTLLGVGPGSLRSGWTEWKPARTTQATTPTPPCRRGARIAQGHLAAPAHERAIMVALQVPGPDEAGHALLLLALEDPRRIGRVDAEATHGVTPLLRLVGDRAALVIVRRGDPSAGIDAVTRWLAALRRALTDDPS